MRSLLRIAALAAVAIVLACGDETAGPEENGGGGGGGEYITRTITFETPATDDAAVVVTISASATPEIEGGPYPWLFPEPVGNSLRVAVLGTITDGELLRVRVPAGSAAGLTAVLVEVAATDNELRADLSGYSLAVAGP